MKFKFFIWTILGAIMVVFTEILIKTKEQINIEFLDFLLVPGLFQACS